jgi:hypothetical protein
MGAFTFFILQDTAARKQPESTVTVNIGIGYCANICNFLNMQSLKWLVEFNFPGYRVNIKMLGCIQFSWVQGEALPTSSPIFLMERSTIKKIAVDQIQSNFKKKLSFALSTTNDNFAPAFRRQVF